MKSVTCELRSPRVERVATAPASHEAELIPEQRLYVAP